ncbi:MAG TPA: hypothetical protein VGH76_15700 [Actinomycetospora sp.]|jgi:hypothetical protein
MTVTLHPRPWSRSSRHPVEGRIFCTGPIRTTLDVRAAFVAHSACASRPWITRFGGPDPLRSGAPNADGQAAIARLVAAAVAAPAPAPAAPQPAAPSSGSLLRVSPGQLVAPLFGAGSRRHPSRCVDEV